MKYLLSSIAPILLSVFLCFTVCAQSTNYYYEQSTRYGTFHYYSNGGVKLVSGRDYAAEIARSQQEFYSRKESTTQISREQVDKRRRELYERERALNINRQQQEAANRERLKKLELQLAEEKRLKTEADYMELKNILDSAPSLNDQIRLLEFMAEIKPVDEDLLILFGCMVKAGRPARALTTVLMKMSADFKEKRNEDINSGYIEAYIRQAEYENALERCNWKFDDANIGAQHLYAAIQFKDYHRAMAVADSIEVYFSGAASLMSQLRKALQLFRNSEARIDEKSQLAELLYQYALQRRIDGKLDFMNLVLLTSSVRLDPKPVVYREERLYLNSIMNCHKEQAADEAYFLNQ